MTAGASLLDLIGERTSSERAPAVRAFAEAFLRRLSADGADGDGLAPDALCGEIVGAFEFASARGAEPIAVRAFTPTLEEHGYELPGSVVETNTEDWPFLVDSVSAELRGARARDPPRAAPDRRRRARRRRRDRGGPAPARGLAPRVDHALRPRAAAHATSSWAGLEEALRKVLSDVRATVKDFPAMADRARRMVQLAGAGAARYTDEEVDETVAFLEWLLRDNFIFLGYREYRFRDGAISVVPDSGLGILSGDRAVDVREAGAGRVAAARRARAGARGRPADRLQDQPALARPPPRADGLHRRAPHLRRRRDRRRGADARPVHHQGLQRAGQPDAAAAPQAAPDPALRGPDRGLARLQGRRSRCSTRSPRTSCSPPRPTTCAARSWRCSRCRASRCGCSAAATPTPAARR